MHFSSRRGGGVNLGIVCVPSLIVPAGKQNSIFFYINSTCESVTEGKKKEIHSVRNRITSRQCAGLLT